jgi:azurin
MTNRGWSSEGQDPYGIDRLVWTGKTPFEMKEVRARPDGFEITFTQPVDRALAADPENYELTSFTYHYHSDYGSEIINQEEPHVTRVQVKENGRSVRIAADSLRPGYIHEINLQDLTSASGVPLLHDVGYYTLNHIPEGEPLATTDRQRTAPSPPPSPEPTASSADGDASPPQQKHQTERPEAWTGGPDRTITIGTEPGLKYDKTEIRAEAGARIKLTFENTDDLTHNLLLLRPGTVASVAEAALNMGTEGPTRDYVPRSDDVLVHTSVLEPETTESIYFTVPDEPGDYPYACTFPGHWRTMQGLLRVTE